MKLRSQLNWLVVAAMVMVYLTCAFLIQLLNARSGQFADDPAGSIALLLAFSAYMATGVMILLRRPGNVDGLDPLVYWSAGDDRRPGWSSTSPMRWKLGWWMPPH